MARRCTACRWSTPPSDACGPLVDAAALVGGVLEPSGPPSVRSERSIWAFARDGLVAPFAEREFWFSVMFDERQLVASLKLTSDTKTS